jgi:hypothetical protein
MSDYDDDMDVDALPARDSVMFSADNTNSKGKRPAANLPVEAEDSLPWWVLLKYFGSMTLIFICRVEKFRPDTLEDVSGHQDILATINKFVETNVCFPTALEVHSSHVNMHHRDSLISFSMVRPVPAKPPLSLP